MRNILIVVLVLICSTIFGQGVSYRIEAMGSDMAGIISDHETDVLRNPAHIFDGNFVRLQRSPTYFDRVYYYYAPLFSGFLVKKPFSILFEGSTYYDKSSSSYTLHTTIKDSKYSIQGRILGGLTISSIPIGLEVATEINNITQERRNELFYDTLYMYNAYYNVSHIKIGGIFGEKNTHEISVSEPLSMRHIRSYQSSRTPLEIEYSMTSKPIPRLTYLYSNTIQENKKYFHLLVDIGSPYSIGETRVPSNIYFYEINYKLLGKITAGWEDFIHSKILIGYGCVYKVDMTLAKIHYKSYEHNLILPVSIEYKPTNFLFLRAGTSTSLTLNDVHDIYYNIGSWNTDISFSFSYSLGMGLKYKRFSCDFVLPSSDFLVINYWKIRACFDL